MADFREAFATLDQLDANGCKALAIASMMWEETWRGATCRAEKAEWLLERLNVWATSCGHSFEMKKTAARWDADHASQPTGLLSWHQEYLAARSEKTSEPRVRLACALSSEKKAVLRAHAERARADAAEAEQTRLLKEIAGLQAAGAYRGVTRDAAREVEANRTWRSRPWLAWAHRLRPWTKASIWNCDLPDLACATFSGREGARNANNQPGLSAHLRSPERAVRDSQR